MYLGRVDDVINPSGHRLGTAEIESALVACKEVSEAAVVVTILSISQINSNRDFHMT